jgi:hypothetical protein
MSFLYFAANASKLAHNTQTENRWHGVGVMVAVLVALGSAYPLILPWGYRYGASTFSAWPLTWRVPQVFERTAGFMDALSRGPSDWTWAGMGIALVLVRLHRTFLWWPLSPSGFVVASSWNIANQIWSSVFLGWFAGALVRRYGGLKVDRNLRPFFLGLILGDAVTFCATAVLETLVGVKG